MPVHWCGFTPCLLRPCQGMPPCPRVCAICGAQATCSLFFAWFPLSHFMDLHTVNFRNYCTKIFFPFLSPRLEAQWRKKTIITSFGLKVAAKHLSITSPVKLPDGRVGCPVMKYHFFPITKPGRADILIAWRWKPLPLHHLSNPINFKYKWSQDCSVWLIDTALAMQIGFKVGVTSHESLRFKRALGVKWNWFRLLLLSGRIRPLVPWLNRLMFLSQFYSFPIPFICSQLLMKYRVQVSVSFRLFLKHDHKNHCAIKALEGFLQRAWKCKHWSGRSEWLSGRVYQPWRRHLISFTVITRCHCSH